MSGQQRVTINDPKNKGIFILPNSFQSPTIYHLIRVLLCIIFLWSGISKLLSPKEFAVIINSYGLVPEAWIMPLAVFLPLLEMIFGLGLLLDIKGSLAGITGLLMLFTVILGYGIRLGLDVDCGCFGPQDLESQAYHSLRPALYRDFAMIAGVIFLYFWRHSHGIKPIKISLLIKKTMEKWRMEDAFS